MKVFFFEPYTINSHHFGTCLELMTDHLKSGDEVFFLGCNAELPTCDVNFEHTKDGCRMCTARRDAGLQRIKKYGKFKYFNLNDFISDHEKNKISNSYHFNDVEELKKLSVDGYDDLGYAVASSIISIKRDPLPDTIILQELINKFIYSSRLVYEVIDRAVQKIKPERLYAYNGRYSVIRPALRVCEKYSIDIYLHESGSDLTKYILTKNNLIHDIAYIQKLIADFWNDDKRSVETKTNKAEEFYLGNRKGVSRSWHSFTDKHIWELPPNWNADKKNIVIFTSSEDEFAAIGDAWKQPIYKTQDEGIKRIADALRDEMDLEIWVRLHPNLKTAPKKLLEPYLAISCPNLHLIMPEENVSSYLLMDNADKVVSFGSSMGIEATYWGKISILLGMSFYKGLRVTYEANGHEDGVSLILDNSLNPLDKLPAIKYGFYFGNFGITYKHFKKTGIFTGTIEGWDFSIPNKISALQKTKNKLKRALQLLKH